MHESNLIYSHGKDGSKLNLHIVVKEDWKTVTVHVNEVNKQSFYQPMLRSLMGGFVQACMSNTCIDKWACLKELFVYIGVEQDVPLVLNYVLFKKPF